MLAVVLLLVVVARDRQLLLRRLVVPRVGLGEVVVLLLRHPRELRRCMG